MNNLFSYDLILKIPGVEVLGVKEGFVSSVSIDSRNATKDSIFIPLVGEVTDGNLYIESAVKNGCRCSLVLKDFYIKNSDIFSRMLEEYEITFFVVNDTLDALHKLAELYIGQFKKLKVISITGSSGKTTTKEVLGSILKSFKPTLVTEGNYNSETGLPLTVFRINKGHELAVLEMGMSRPGEIKALVDIINPDISIITNIGSAHIGFFGSRDGIAKEKKSAFANFIGKNIGIIPSWDDYSVYLSKDVKGRVVSVSKSPEYISGVKNLGFDGWEFEYEGMKVVYPYMGEYNLLNAYMAITCARELGCPGDFIVKGLEHLPSMFGRGEVLNGKNRVIRDCYNANPESTLNSLELLRNTTWSGEKVPIIGSMLELGENSDFEHEKILNFAIKNFQKVIFVGKEFEGFFKLLKKGVGIHFFSDTTSLKGEVASIVGSGSLILLKASRGVRLESITDSIL